LHERERPGRLHARVLLYAWGAWLLGFYSLMLLSFVLGPVEQSLGPSSQMLVLLSGVAVGATGPGGFVFGWISDRWGRRASIGAALLVTSAGNLACCLAPSAGWLVIARALSGVGIGGTWGAGHALIAETFPSALRGRFGAVAQSGAPLGLGLAALVGSFLSPLVGWRTCFLLSAVPALALLACHGAPESDLWAAHRRGTERGLPALLQLVRGELAGRFARAFVLTVLNMSAYWFAVIWLPRYLQRERGLSLFGSGWWTLTFVAGSLTGYLSFGLISDAIGRRRAFTAYCALTVVGLLPVTLLWERVGSSAAFGMGCLFLAGVGTGTWSCYGAYLAELFPTRVRGTAMAVIMNCSRGAQFVAPVVIAGVAGRWGLSGGIALAAVFAALAGAWVWTLPETAGCRLDPS
jgi:MFS family permease